LSKTEGFLRFLFHDHFRASFFLIFSRGANERLLCSAVSSGAFLDSEVCSAAFDLNGFAEGDFASGL
jgi:hypothetical protein